MEKKKKKYVKPETVVIKVEPTKDLMITSCVCNNCQCDHNNNSGSGGNNSQAHCGCSRRPKNVPPIPEEEWNW